MKPILEQSNVELRQTVSAHDEAIAELRAAVEVLRRISDLHTEAAWPEEEAEAPARSEPSEEPPRHPERKWSRFNNLAIPPDGRPAIHVSRLSQAQREAFQRDTGEELEQGEQNQ